MTVCNPHFWAPYRAPIAGMAKLFPPPCLHPQPSFSPSLSTSRQVRQEEQPAQEDWLVGEDLVRVSITSGVLGHFEAAVEQALLRGSRSREPD